MERRADPQAQLFTFPSQPRPYVERESVYQLVILLRWTGRRVYRVGRLHKVDAQLLTFRELEKLADRVISQMIVPAAKR